MHSSNLKVDDHLEEYFLCIGKTYHCRFHIERRRDHLEGVDLLHRVDLQLRAATFQVILGNLTIQSINMQNIILFTWIQRHVANKRINLWELMIVTSLHCNALVKSFFKIFLDCKYILQLCLILSQIFLLWVSLCSNKNIFLLPALVCSSLNTCRYFCSDFYSVYKN